MSGKKILTITLSVNLIVIFVLFALFGSGTLRLPTALAQEGTDPSAAALFGDVPTQMNYQGFLTDDDGIPLGGTHNLTVAIYERTFSGFPPSFGWTKRWEETHTGVAIHKGLFNLTLGSQTALDPLLFDGAGLFATGRLELGVKVDGGLEISPRTPLLTVPYAFRSEATNSFPLPDYDSGWETINQGQAKTLTHSLGGDPDHYFVYLTFKDTGASGINHRRYGSYYNGTDSYGGYWRTLTDSTVIVWRGWDDDNMDEFRIQIWVMK